MELFKTQTARGIVYEVSTHDDRETGGPIISGSFIMEEGGARITRQTWADLWVKTDDVYPGPISAIRAIARGEV